MYTYFVTRYTHMYSWYTNPPHNTRYINISSSSSVSLQDHCCLTNTLNKCCSIATNNYVTSYTKDSPHVQGQNSKPKNTNTEPRESAAVSHLVMVTSTTKSHLLPLHNIVIFYRNVTTATHHTLNSLSD